MGEAEKDRDRIRGCRDETADVDNATLEAIAKSSEKVKAFIDGKTVKKVIVVPKKMVNIVVA